MPAPPQLSQSLLVEANYFTASLEMDHARAVVGTPRPPLGRDPRADANEASNAPNIRSGRRCADVAGATEVCGRCAAYENVGGLFWEVYSFHMFFFGGLLFQIFGG